MRTTKIALLFLVIACGQASACDVPPPPRCDASSWIGTWQTNWGDMTLEFTGDEKFVGTYGRSGHSVTGEINPEDASVLAGVWKHAGTNLTGRFRFEMSVADMFSGAWTWGDNDPSKGGGIWTGSRPKEIKLSAKPIGEAKVTWTDDSGKRWIAQEVQVENDTGEEFYVYGYSNDQPFIQISVKDSKTGKMNSVGRGYCGTGAGLHKIERGASFNCFVGLSEDQIGGGFTVGLTRYPKKEWKGGLTIETEVMQMNWNG